MEKSNLPFQKYFLRFRRQQYCNERTILWKKIVGTLALPFPGNGKCLEYVKKVFFASKPRLRLFLKWKIQTRGLEFSGLQRVKFFLITLGVSFSGKVRCSLTLEQLQSLALPEARV